MELNAVYDALSATLRNQKLDWVINQVEQQIRIGKTVEVQKDTLRVVSRSANQLTIASQDSLFAKGPKDNFPVTQEYTSRERVILLVDAIEQVISDTADMEQQINEFFTEKQKLSHWHGLIFIPEDIPDEEGIAVTPANHSRLETGRRLRTLLTTVKQRI